MTHRERYLRAVRFKPVDRLPINHAYGLMPGVLASWHDDGLPTAVQSDDNIREYFGFEPQPLGLPISIGLVPANPPRVITDTDEERIAIDEWGRKTRLLKRVTTLPLAIEYPVENWNDWIEIKSGVTWCDERIGSNLEEIAAKNVDDGLINRFGFRGFFWFVRDLMGEMNLSIAYYENPDLVHDINDTWCCLLENVLINILERTHIDEVFIVEDMAYKTASMIGKATFDEFMAPYYARIKQIVENYEVPVFSVDTDGNVNELIHWFASCGVNCTGPNEVRAGNDIVEYRKVFGSSMAFFGGLDKLVLPMGRDAIEEMLDYVVPPMMEAGGGWIVSLDHRIVPGTKLADFQYYLDRVRELVTFL